MSPLSVSTDDTLSGYRSVNWWFVVGWQEFVETEVLADVRPHVLLQGTQPCRQDNDRQDIANDVM